MSLRVAAPLTGVGFLLVACALPDPFVYSSGSPDASSQPGDGGGSVGGGGDGATTSDANANANANDDAGPDGVACGGNGIDGDSSTLYQRTSGTVSVVQTCQRGCEWTDDHTDKCRADATCDDGDGLYCGNDGLPGAPEVLFHCGGGKVVPQERCPNGCQQVRSGLDDHCK